MRGGFYRLLVVSRKLGQRLGWHSASASTVYPKVTDRNRTSDSLFRAPKLRALI